MILRQAIKFVCASVLFFAATALWISPAFAAISLTPVVLPNGTQTVAYDQTITASGGTGPYTYTLTGSLPAGLSLNGSTGEITGTPSTTGFSNFTITATDSTSAQGSRAYSISVGTASLTLLPTSLPAATQGSAYSQTITAAGGTAPYSFTVSSGPLPTGLSLTSAGVLSGTPSVNGSYGFIIQATDTNGNTGYRTYSMIIGSNSLTFSPTSLPNGSQGTPYNQTVTASGGGGTYAYAVSTGTLPTGLTLNGSSGAISGTPTGSGTSNFTIGATDSYGDTGSQAFSLSIGANSLNLAPTTLPNGTQGTAYSQTVTASGGTGGYTYSVTSGALPIGLSLNASTGAITGTPTGGGASTFAIGVVDSSSDTGSRSYTVHIGTNSLTVTPATLPNGTQGTPYSQSVGATGGTAPYTFAVTTGSLPAGLSLNPSTGAITGTPTATGTANITIGATDAFGDTGSGTYAVTINTAPLTVNPASLPAATKGTAYSQTVSASGGTAPYTYAIIAGALPGGLTFNTSTGAITGTPTASGAFNFTVQATDSTPNTGTRAYTLNVGTNTLTVSPSSLPAGTQGTAYSQTLSASGGTGPYTFTITAGTLPAGLSLNASTGAITGTPTATGTSNFTVQALDSNGDVGTHAYSMSVGGNSLTVGPASLPAAVLGSLYSQTITASGGTGPYIYSIVGGALPAGVSLNAGTGAISGVPTASGPANFTVEAQDANGDVGTRAYSVNVGSTILTVSPATLPNGTQGIAYSQTVAAAGGTGPYTYSLAAGTLPAGLSLNATNGVISGTPTGSGASGFTVAALDTLGDTGSRAYTVNIGTNSLTLNPTSLPAGTVGTAYSQAMSVNGGTAPYTFAIIAGALPAGLTLNPSTGAITGTPTAGGVANFTVRVTDANGNIASRAFAMPTGTNSLTINPASLPAAVQGTPYSQTVSASGGTAPYSYAIIAGALPPGLSFNGATGVISGTPSGRGSFSVTVQARDANGDTGSRAYTTVAVRPNPASDPDVQGLVAAQAATARRFATTQVTNVATHLEELHDGFDPCLMNGGVGVTVADPISGLPVPLDPNAPNAANARGTQLGSPNCTRSNNFPFALWSGGAVQFGSATLNGQSNRFSTGGLTFGADGRILDNLIVGAAFGYGSDHTDIGSDGTNSVAQTFSGTFYASYRPFDHWFLDTVAGYGTLDFNNQRFATFNDSTIAGTRAGSDWFVSVILSADVKSDALTISPYARADMTSVSLQSYAEQGGNGLGLSYGAVGFGSAAGVVGVRAVYDLPAAWGVLSPMARLEYRRELDGGFNQSMFYTDLGSSQSFVLNQADASLNLVTATIGLRARAGEKVSGQIEYGVTGGSESTLMQSLRATLRIAF